MNFILDWSIVNHFGAGSEDEIGSCSGLGRRRKGSGDVSCCDRTEIAALGPSNVEGTVE